ncbi:MAG: EmrB/QacA family drug resistance transporter [Rhodospirillales bacterium]|nr:EmrB/QacA family drug resistance transporter [Rhodospirillales bacterium]
MTVEISGEQVPDPRAWLAVAGAIFGTFMALLDVSVTNASLPQIQGEIGATGTEGTWIGTGYLVSEIVMIPLTAWFSRLFGLRNFLILASIFFTLFSVMCGFSGNLTEMIVGRVGQGFFGGALIPASLTIIATRLTPAQRPAGLAIYASVATLAPVIGPILGGWLTENVSWHWLFLMNLPIAVILLFMLYLGIERASPDWDELGRADWFGIAGLAMFLSGLTVILEEGQRENWFDSTLITRLTIMATVGFILVLVTQFTSTRPVVKLRLLAKSNYRAVVGIMILFGAGSFTLLYVIPVFLGIIAGYDAEQTGFIATYTGLSTFLMMPVLMVLMQKVDVRWIVGSGMILFGAGCLLNLGLTPDSVGHDFILAQLINGMGQPMVGLPLSQAATAGLDEDEIPDGTALFSMARNLGGSLGLAMTGILIDRRSAFHTAQLEQVTTANSGTGQERIAQIAGSMIHGGADTNHATLQALRAIAGEVQRQALVMSYIDGFWIMGIGIILAVPAVLFLQKPSGSAAAVAH